jgi:hypothetical protein
LQQDEPQHALFGWQHVVVDASTGSANTAATSSAENSIFFVMVFDSKGGTRSRPER